MSVAGATETCRKGGCSAFCTAFSSTFTPTLDRWGGIARLVGARGGRRLPTSLRDQGFAR